MRKLRLSRLAEGDIENILAHSHVSFGETARRRYEALIETALRDIAIDPDRMGVKLREELGRGVRTYHLFYSRESGRTEHGLVRKPRHLLVFRLTEPNILHIGRVLHDAMDLSDHLPEE